MPLKALLPISLLLIAAMQSAWINGWQVRGVAPDLLLTWSVSLGLCLGLQAGTVAGFAAGFIQGTLHGDNLGSFIVSRSLAGMIGGIVQERISHENPIAPSLAVFVASAASQAAYFLMAPRFPLADWATDSLLLCSLNAVAAPLLHFPMSAAIGRAVASDAQSVIRNS